MITLSHSKSIKTLRPNDPNFMLMDGIMVSPRAGFEIDKGCPREYLYILQTCIDRGWIKPIANVSEREMLFAGLTKSK